MKHALYTIGLDEVGRGPIAGPVTVGCVALPKKYTWGYFAKLHARGLVPPLRDSKKLTVRQREEWYAWVRTHGTVVWAVSSRTSLQIDIRGITTAANSAADTAYRKCLAHLNGSDFLTKSEASAVPVVLDHGLSVASAYKQTMHTKGDERFVVIALASIMAKVTRDRYMQTVDKSFPMYSFATNKGYGSKAHYTALYRHGLCKEHRASFIHL